jgi:formylglycine-generating enzyme required for sulfatase activity
MKIIRVLCCSLGLSVLCSDSVRAGIVFGSGANQFMMDFVPIGDPGNAADTTGSPNPAGTVDCAFDMGKFEVSRDMITKANAEGGLGITMFDMSAIGGNGVDRPATGVRWNQAARFVNWLNTSEGFPAAYKFSAQPGEMGYDPNENNMLWTIGEPGYNAANTFRNSLARYVLPDVNEWYKAAYYDPNAKGGLGGYSNFPTGSDTPPTPVASGTTSGTAVYDQPSSQGPADITMAGGLSPYGVMALGGNAYEMLETEPDLGNDGSSDRRIARGGSWDSPDIPNFLSASLRAEVDVLDVNHVVGFRVASVPEAGSLLCCGVAALGLACWKWLAS